MKIMIGLSKKKIRGNYLYKWKKGVNVYELVIVYILINLSQEKWYLLQLYPLK